LQKGGMWGSGASRGAKRKPAWLSTVSGLWSCY
jgi:hypothetical protein